MMYLPQPPKSKQDQWKDSVRREQHLRNRRLRDKPGLSKMMRNQLSTTQGMSTLKTCSDIFCAWYDFELDTPEYITIY